MGERSLICFATRCIRGSKSAIRGQGGFVGLLARSDPCADQDCRRRTGLCKIFWKEQQSRGSISFSAGRSKAVRLPLGLHLSCREASTSRTGWCGDVYGTFGRQSLGYHDLWQSFSDAASARTMMLVLLISNSGNGRKIFLITSEFITPNLWMGRYGMPFRLAI
jgi:hypothetical protein